MRDALPRAWRATRPFAPGLVMGLGCLLIFGERQQHAAPLAQPLRAIPLALAGHPGHERQMTEAERQAVGVSDYVFRIFGADSLAAFSVYIGYYESQATGKTIHSPRNCLPGAGWQPVESGTASLAVGDREVTVNRYLLANGPSQALVYYWYQGRGRVAHNEYLVKWDLLRDAITSGRSEEALVRIVVPVPAAPGFTVESWRQRVAEAEALARRAAVELIPRVETALPTWGAPRARA